MEPLSLDKQEILRLAYVTGTCDRTVRSVLRNLSGEGVQRMSKARAALVAELSKSVGLVGDTVRAMLASAGKDATTIRKGGAPKGPRSQIYKEELAKVTLWARREHAALYSGDK